MSIFGKVLGAGIRIAFLPVDLAKDVLTLGGAITDQPMPYTAQSAKKISRNINDAIREIEND